MYHVTTQTVNTALPILAGRLLAADEVGSRNGRAHELTHVALTLKNPLLREILLPSRKASIAAQIAETMWVLSGRGDIRWLSHYLPRAKDFSDDGVRWRGAYGPRIRAWQRRDGDPFDQLSYVVDLLRGDPMTRRAVISIYDPDVDSAAGKDIPCNDFIAFTNRLGRLDAHVFVRSNDLIWGWSGINAFEWSVLLELVAHLVGVEPGSLHFSIASLHVYAPHWERARSLANEIPTFPSDPVRLCMRERTIDEWDVLAEQWFRIEERIREDGPAKADEWVKNFREPLLRSWLRVLQWWWSGDQKYLELSGAPNLVGAAAVGIQPKALSPQTVSNLLSLVHEGQRPVTDDEIESWGQDTRKQVSDWASAVHLNASDHTGVAVPAMPSVLRPTYEDRAGEFSRALADLHSEKHRVYGDSWKKRGEMIGILANIARKVDRLGVDGGGDTSLDTAMDLAIYLAKYLAWLDDQANGTNTSSGDGVPNDRILATRPSGARNIGVAEDALRRGFEILESVVSQGQDRRAVAEQLYTVAYNLAYRLWWHSQNKTRSWNPDA